MAVVYKHQETHLNRRRREVITEEYKICYGRIQSMFVYSLQLPDEETTHDEVFLECNWYEITGTNPITGIAYI